MLYKWYLFLVLSGRYASALSVHRKHTERGGKEKYVSLILFSLN